MKRFQQESVSSSNNNKTDNEMMFNINKKIKVEIDDDDNNNDEYDNEETESEDEEAKMIPNIDQMLMVKVEEDSENEDVELVEDPVKNQLIRVRNKPTISWVSPLFFSSSTKKSVVSYKCSYPDCVESFEANQLKLHLQQTHRWTDVNQCDKCDVFCETVPALRDHQTEEHGGPSLKFLCPFCLKYQNKNKTGLIRHCTQMHYEQYQIMKWCDNCDTLLPVGKMESHLEEVHQKSPTPRKRRPKKAFPCPHCKKFAANSASWLTRHCREMHPKEYYAKLGGHRCLHPACMESFAEPTDLQCHLTEAHGWPPMSICEECGQICSSNLALAQHQKVKHANKTKMASPDISEPWVLTHPCSYCPDFQSPSKEGYLEHCSQVHPEVDFTNPTMCSYCFTFLPSRDIRKHTLTFHPKALRNKLDTSVNDNNVQQTKKPETSPSKSSLAKVNSVVVGHRKSAEPKLLIKKDKTSQGISIRTISSNSDNLTVRPTTLFLVQTPSKPLPKQFDLNHSVVVKGKQRKSNSQKHPTKTSVSNSAKTKTSSASQVSNGSKTSSSQVSNSSKSSSSTQMSISSETSSSSQVASKFDSPKSSPPPPKVTASGRVSRQINKFEFKKEFPIYSCLYCCKFQTTTKQGLIKHCKSRHAKKYSLTLEKEASKLRIQNQWNVHTEPNVDEDDDNDEVQFIGEKVVNNITCPICSFQTSNKKSLVAHCKEKHMEKYMKALDKANKLKLVNQQQPGVAGSSKPDETSC